MFTKKLLLLYCITVGLQTYGGDNSNQQWHSGLPPSLGRRDIKEQHPNFQQKKPAYAKHNETKK